MMNAYLQVALGGAIGATARFAVTRWSVAAFGPGLPLGTLAVNVIGSLAIGVLAALLLGARETLFAPLLIPGILGGFTTFSAFSLDALSLWERGQGGLAVAYVVGSVTLSLAAAALGLTLGRAALA